MSKRRGSSELYQVDFIAALFGGFLLLWLARPSSPAQERPPPVITMSAYLTLSSGEQLAVLPFAAIEATCVEPNLAAAAPLKPDPCVAGSEHDAGIVDSTGDINNVDAERAAELIADWVGDRAPRDSVLAAFRRQPRLAAVLDPAFDVDPMFAGIAFRDDRPVAVALGTETPLTHVKLSSCKPYSVIAYVACDTVGQPRARDDATTLCSLTDSAWTETTQPLTLELRSRRWGRLCASASLDVLCAGPVQLTREACPGPS